jgi:hypothetical protein
MMNDPLGEPINDKIMQAVCEAMLNGLCKKLREDGWNVKVSQGELGYLIEFGKPGEPKNTARGDTAPQALEDLCRNLTQLGFFPRELREMQHQLDGQLSPIRDALLNGLLNKLRNDGWNVKTDQADFTDT